MLRKFLFSKNPVTVRTPDDAWVYFFTEELVPIAATNIRHNTFEVDDQYLTDNIFYAIIPAYISTERFNQQTPEVLVSKLEELVLDTPIEELGVPEIREGKLRQGPGLVEGVAAKILITDRPTVNTEQLFYGTQQIPKNYWVPVYGDYIHSLEALSYYDGVDTVKSVSTDEIYTVTGLKGKNVLCIM